MREKIKEATTIVVKMGTTSITHSNGTLDLKKLDSLARVLTDLENSGKKIVLVSSGAIGAGMNRMGMKERPKTLKDKQAAASVGQGLLMKIYHKFFDEYHQNVGQILLTKDVFKHSIKRNNAINTFNALIERGIIPIVNENDCIATDEIQEECFGDNDILSAMTADIVGSDLLVILSDVDGLYDDNPSVNKEASLINTVLKIDNNIMKSAGNSGSDLGTGGMITKLGAAKYATNCGIDVVIASGDICSILYDILDGKEVGTFFLSDVKDNLVN
ncbi:glutamate 5-kinase [Acetobacterium tundrae]|uniref:Glutamate 5-kinase n=1 Tax=Acetobacterium tundrae TaxID=132932 RepID=A0ABR6WQP7_9FIRM|nr:glutamate 5-kinase [Acetobacterium tundrae]MBC3798447.1 glutamate 5-kinase [Acetobacterium tundrae]